MDKNGITRSIIIYHYTNEITVNIKIMDIFYYFLYNYKRIVES